MFIVYVGGGSTVLVTHQWLGKWWATTERKSLAPGVWLLFTTGVCSPWIPDMNFYLIMEEADLPSLTHWA